jgi:hypothetical protein
MITGLIIPASLIRQRYPIALSGIMSGSVIRQTDYLQDQGEP